MENVNLQNNEVSVKKREFSMSDYLKFIVPSVIGVLLLMVPFKYQGETTIVVALLAGFLQDILGDSLPYIITGFIAVTAVLTVLYKVSKPDFIENNDFLRNVYDVSWIWVLVRIAGLILAVMALFQLGPEAVWNEDTGGLILFDLLKGLFSIFLFGGLLLPFLTDFGLLEFVGVLLTPIMRPFFKLPGRSSIDCVASWVGDGTVGVTLTNNQYIQGYYTAREAAVIATTFSAVSITFCLVVLKQVDLAHMFGPYYLTIVVSGLVAAIIMPRIPPLSLKPNTYYTGKSKDLGEDIPHNFTTVEWGLQLAVEKAESHQGLKFILINGLKTALDLWLAVLPVIMAFGTTAVIIAEYTSFFQILGTPFLPLLRAFNVPEAEAAAQTIMVGFSDMFLPSVLASGIESEMTRFIIATLSVSQLVYLSEAGAVILGTEIPITPLDMFIIFIERTVITLPVIIIIAKMLF